MSPLRRALPSLSALAVLSITAVPGCRELIDHPVLHIPDWNEIKAGQVTTYAGTGIGGYDGHGHHRLKTQLYWPTDVYVNQQTSDVYIVDWNNHIIREVTWGSDLVETVAGGQKLDEGTVNTINHPTSINFTGDGNLLISAWHNHQIRMGVSADALQILYGTVQGFSGNGSIARFCRLNLPTSVAWGADSTMYISDMGNRKIRKILANDPNTGERLNIRDRYIQAFAGASTSSTGGFGGDGGPAAQALFDCPFGTASVPGFRLITSDDKHYLYIADSFNHRIRRIDLMDAQNTITTVAGSGTTGEGNGGYSGDGGPATSARLNFPTDVDIDADGSLFICDTGNHVVRRVAPDGTITTVAGKGAPGFSGDGSSAANALLSQPDGIALDRVNRLLFIADQNNHRIRVVKLPALN